MEKSELILHKARNNKILAWITRYNIHRDGKIVESNIKGWQTALAHARKWQTDLFYNVRKVEIVNLWTAEIIDLKEAERRAANYARRLKGAANTSTT